MNNNFKKKGLLCITTCNDCGEVMDECRCDQLCIEEFDKNEMKEWEKRGAESFRDYAQFVTGKTYE